MNKTRVKILYTSQHGDFEKDDRGYIDGYVRGANDVPYAVVALDSGRFGLVDIIMGIEKE